jgi:hypothetical protein
LVVKASLIMNLCLEGQLWVLHAVLRCCHVNGTKWEENDQVSGVMDGPCTMTIPQVTQLWQCINFWWKDVALEDPLYRYMVGISKPALLKLPSKVWAANSHPVCFYGEYCFKIGTPIHARAHVCVCLYINDKYIITNYGSNNHQYFL